MPQLNREGCKHWLEKGDNFVHAHLLSVAYVSFVEEDIIEPSMAQMMRRVNLFQRYAKWASSYLDGIADQEFMLLDTFLKERPGDNIARNNHPIIQLVLNGCRCFAVGGANERLSG